ncbi:MAG: hypothetical protein WC002_00125 [Candidatus Muiribacteriota bacterium]
MTDTVSFIYKIEKNNLCKVANVFEAHEGVANIHTLDKKTRLVEFMVSESQIEDFRNIIAYFEKENLVSKVEKIPENIHVFSSKIIT